MTRLALGGDSAGANWAAVQPTAFALLPGRTRCALCCCSIPSRTPPRPAIRPNVSPLQLHKLPALPPTVVTTAEYDVLRDEGLAYAQKLEAAGVAVTHLHGPDMHHNFPVHPGAVARFPHCNAALTDIAGWLRSMLVRGC